MAWWGEALPGTAGVSRLGEVLVSNADPRHWDCSLVYRAHMLGESKTRTKVFITTELPPCSAGGRSHLGSPDLASRPLSG